MMVVTERRRSRRWESAKTARDKRKSSSETVREARQLCQYVEDNMFVILEYIVVILTMNRNKS